MYLVLLFPQLVCIILINVHLSLSVSLSNVYGINVMSHRYTVYYSMACM